MAHERFFYSGVIDAGEGLLQVREDEHHHLSRVIRMRSGDRIHVGNGRGIMYECVIEEIGSDETLCRIIAEHPGWGEDPFSLHLAVGIIRESRWEWMIEKAVELGVDEITPLLCDNVQKKRLRLERSRKIILAAAKQCGRSKIPSINAVVSFNDFVSGRMPGKCFIFDNGSESEDLEKLLQEKKGRMTLLLGPEGGFSKQEVDFAIKKDYLSATLGVRRLRTETAALKALVLCSGS